MTITPENAATWRDLADRLTDDQLARIERMEAMTSPFTADETAVILLRAARECIESDDDDELREPTRPCSIPGWQSSKRATNKTARQRNAPDDIHVGGVFVS